ncbi:TolC family protein [Imtechella halotolerans]|uniref:Outer membrane efflux protein n=1 Tax=Imtechella halotolerans K1 TaxID=946077 RepID=I0WHU3_9FLAO|nr:TolC family protein [Imtechella halotolerans]EID75959.1 outer membrane efflux protein [Imtechella halotolerans K1]WMQ63150.1 TolC family protein [Imtechella halotolerans]
MKRKTNYLLLFLVLMTGLVSAQETITISKAEVLLKVMENNIEIRMTEQDFIQSRADYRQSNAVFLPNITLSHTGYTTTNPLMAFGSKLNQEIISQSDFNPDLLNNPERITNFATKLEVQQPLLNIDGVLQRQAAKNKMEAVQLQGQRTKDYMVLKVEESYMQLQLAYKAINVLEKAYETALANKKMADDSFKQGYLQKADVLAVEVRVTDIQNQLLYAKSNVKNASDYLQFLMDEDNKTILIPSDDLIATTSLNEIESSLPKNRTDIQAMELATKAYKKAHQADNMAFLPRLNAFGSYELYDDKMFQADAKGYLIGAQLSWNILDGSKRIGKSQKSKAEYDKAELHYRQYISKSQMELEKAQRMFSDVENKLKLTKLAMQQSEESLRIRTNRFAQGLEKATELLQSETLYSQKQLEYLQTVYEYNYTLAYLQFLTKA